MTLFAWLLVGHLIGDWFLQNDWMARGKKRALVTLPGMTHFAIYTACILLVLWLAGSTPPANLLIIGLAVFASHWLIDATDLVGGWIRLYRQSDIPLMRVMVDQTLHIVVLAIIASVVSV